MKKDAANLTDRYGKYMSPQLRKKYLEALNDPDRDTLKKEIKLFEDLKKKQERQSAECSEAQMAQQGKEIDALLKKMRKIQAKIDKTQRKKS